MQVNVHGGNIATIYKDNGITVAANPLTTDSNGRYEFYAADGRYDIIISGASIPTLQLTDISIVDILPEDLPIAPPPDTQVPTFWNNSGVISIGGSALLDPSQNVFILDQSKLG